MTNTERNKDVARAFLNQFPARTLDLETLYKPDYVHHNDAFYPGLKPGLQNFRDALRAHGGGLSNLALEITHLVAEGDLVVARFAVSGDHTGEFRGIAATGRRISFTATDIYRFEDGKITEGWATLDWMAILQQTTG